MKIITLVTSIVDPSTWEVIDLGDRDICEWLASRWNTLPDNTRIYHGQISDANDVTPHRGSPGQIVNDIDRLRSLEGDIFVVHWPEAPLVILVIVAIALAAVSIALAFLLRPSVPDGQSEGSPNNDLADRQNKARPNERIPDIYGTVRSTPDLIAVPYKIFVSNQEFEIAPMCVGRGSYTILDCKDDITPVDNIGGEFVAVYGPNSSPNKTGAIPVATFGRNPLPSIPEIISVRRSNSVNGQVLRAPNAGLFIADKNTTCVCGDINGLSGSIVNSGTDSSGGTVDFTNYFIPSTTTPTILNSYITFENFEVSDQSHFYHSVWLNGTYLILDVTSDTILLQSPGANQPDGSLWQNGTSSGDVIYNFSGGPQPHGGGYSTDQGNGRLYSGTAPTVGPLVMQVPDSTGCIINIVAPNGLYYMDSNGNQHALSIDVQATIQSVDVNNNPVGLPISSVVTITGRSTDRDYVGVTLEMDTPSTGPFQVTLTRLTNTFSGNSGNLTLQLADGESIHASSWEDQIQWRDMYSSSSVDLPTTQFGDVTTLMAITEQTMDALVIKERKLNLLVTRNLPTWSNRTSGAFSLATGQTTPAFSSTLYPTNNAADIICAMALDPWVGRRTLAEINVPGIYATCDAEFYDTASSGLYGRADGAIASYLEDGWLLTEFCYTFDDAKVSFEESLADIAQALNCTAYRAGSQINLFFEQQTTNSSLLFNHRNTIPDSMQITDTYGTLNDYDGIEYTFIDPNSPNATNQDVEYTLYYPTDQSATNPRKVTAMGVRNIFQANFNGYRLYNKLVNQNSQVEFEATQEAALLILRQRILVADTTRPVVQAGDVVAVSGLIVTGSEDIDWVDGATCTAFFQLANGTVQAITVTNPGTGDKRDMTLATAPSIPLVYSQLNWARTTYILSWSTDPANLQQTAYLVADKQPQNDTTYKMTAINYSPAYYANDFDYPLSKSTAVPPPPFGYGVQGYTGAGSKALNLLITTNCNLSVSSTTTTTGAAILLIAVIQPTGVTGNIQFYDGATLLSAVALISGVAMLTTTLTTVGSHSLSAFYAGDSQYAATTSNIISETVDASGAFTPSTQVELSINNAFPLVNETVTLTAIVSPHTATGTVSFVDSTTSTSLGTASISGGIAALTASFTTINVHAIVATYSGDSVYATSTTTIDISVAGSYSAPPVVSISSSALSSTDNVTITVTWTWPSTYQKPVCFQVVAFEGTDVTNTSSYLFNPVTVTPDLLSYSFVYSPNTNLTNVNACVRAVYA